MKNKLVMIVLSILVVLAAGAMVYAIYSNQSGKEVFAEDGYIIVYDEKDTEKPTKTYHFSEGTAFKRSYEGSIQFRDTEGNVVTADADSFVHYDSGASASLSKSVLMNLDEVGASVHQYYGLNADTPINRSGSKYQISTQENAAVDLSNYLWKVGENRYMMVSDTLTVSFADGRSFDYDDYIELVYQDGGMVSIIHGDEIHRDASSNTYVTIDSGVSVNLATQVILDEDKNARMTLGQLTTDSDQIVNVLPADVPELKIVIPKFNFTVENGKKGSSGSDGSNGNNGADGTVGDDGAAGVDGTGGENGRTGLMGYDGDNGDAGAAGTSGRSGTNGVEGISGVDGMQGPAGAPGNQGGAGGAGAAGSAGAAGAAGPQGYGGQDGDDGDRGTDGAPIVIGDPTAVLRDVPVIRWVDSAPLTAKYSEITGSFGFEMDIDTATVATIKDVEIRLVDIAKGKEVYTQKLTQDVSTGGSSNIVALEGFDHLAPANAYRLTITGSYDHLGTMVTTTFDDRTIVTADFPVDINIYDVGAKSIDFEFINRDADVAPGDNSSQHTHTVEWILVGADGATVKQSGQPLTLSGAIGITTQINADRTTSDHVIISNIDSTPIKSNTQYYFSITSIDGVSDTEKIPSRYRRIPVKTLKALPSISDLQVTVNMMNQSFEFYLGNVTDADQAIQRFRYEVMENGTGKVVKVLYSTNRDMVSCYVDGTDPYTGLGLSPNEYYRVRAVAEVFDNKKNIEIVCDFNDAFTMDGVTQYTWLTYNNRENSLYPNRIGAATPSGNDQYASFSIHLPSGATLQPSQDIKLTIHSNTAQTVTKVIPWGSLTANAGAGISGETVYTFETTFDNLMNSTTYSIDARGMLALTANQTYAETLIGTVIVTTPKYVSGNGNINGHSSTVNPIYFSFELRPDVSGTSTSVVNTSEYAISQAGSTGTHNDVTYIGGAHVQLYAAGVGGQPNVLICETDISLKKDASGYAVPANDFVTLDDFPGNPNEASFGETYIVVITGAYDSTEFKNPIDITMIQAETDRTFSIGKTYPDPSGLSLSVVPITVNNYVEMTKQSIPTIDGLPTSPSKYAKYDPETVLGFRVIPVGVGNWTYFDELYIYVYDNKDYNEHRAPIEAKLKSSLPTLSPGESYSKLSSESITGATGQIFYPDNDDEFYIRYKLDLKKPGGTGERVQSAPTAVFLFDDIDQNDQGASEAKIIATNEILTAGYTKHVDVMNKALTGFYRGHDYNFTFRLRSDNDVMGNMGMYPEVLGEKECVLKCEQTLLAPYEKPSYYFYPADSSSAGFSYGYYVKCVDGPQVLGGNLTLQGASPNGTVVSYPHGLPAATQQNLLLNQDALLAVNNTKVGKIVVSVDENRYVPGYNRSTSVVLFDRFVGASKVTPVIDSTRVVVNEGQSIVEFTITPNTVEMARSICAIVGKFHNNNNGQERSIPLNISTISPSGEIAANCKLADLTTFCTQNDTIRVNYVIYYDTGSEGFLRNEYTNDANNTGYVCVKELTGDNIGKYIVPVGADIPEFEVRADSNAIGSLYKMTVNSSSVGAQSKNIEGTLTFTAGLDAKPGLISAGLRQWDDPTGWFYETGSNSRAKLGGAYDVKITKRNVPYTVSFVQTVEHGDGSDTFQMKGVSPMVNLHSSNGYTISGGINSAEVTFKISGSNGTDMYGRQADPFNNGNIYILLYNVVNTPTGVNYAPYIDPSTGQIRRFKVELTHKNEGSATLPPGDGTYTIKIGDTPDGFKLSPNSRYQIQVVYYDSLEAYNSYTHHYTLDEKFPGNPVEGNYYPIITTDTVLLSGENPVNITYSSRGYNNKQINIKANLADTSAKVQEGVVEFIYALYDDDDNLILTHDELMKPAGGGLNTYLKKNDGEGDVYLDVSPNTLPVGMTKNQATGALEPIYFDFSNSSEGGGRKYKLRLIPMSVSDINMYTSYMQGTYGQATDKRTGQDDGYNSHTAEFTRYYNEWLTGHTLGADTNNTGDKHQMVARAMFAGFGALPELKSAFPNVRAYVDKNDGQNVVFYIGMVDADGVVQNDKYMVRVIDDTGTDITPGEIRNEVYSTLSTRQILVPTNAYNKQVTLKLYYIEDKNSNQQTGIADYQSSFNPTGSPTNPAVSVYTKTKESAGQDGFSVGDIEAVRRGTDENIYIDFIYPTSITKVSQMDVGITLQNGSFGTVISTHNPFADATGACVKSEDGNGYSYRFTAIPSGVFSSGQTYTITIRMYVDGTTAQDNYTVDYIINSFTMA